MEKVKKSFCKIFHSCMRVSCIGSFLFFSSPQVYAQGQSTVASGIAGVLGAAGQGIQLGLQASQPSFGQLQGQLAQQGCQPVQTIASEFFPSCQTVPAKWSKPLLNCEPPIDFSSISEDGAMPDGNMLNQFQSQAQQQAQCFQLTADAYERASSNAQNPNGGLVGTQCMDAEKKRLLAQLEEGIKQIKTLQAGFDKQNAQLLDRLDKAKEKMNDLAAVLEGQAATRNQREALRKLADQMREDIPVCNGVLAPGILTKESGADTGLYEYKKSLNRASGNKPALFDTANNFNPAIITRQIDNAINDIQGAGADLFKDEGRIVGNAFEGSIPGSTGNAWAEAQNAYQRARSELNSTIATNAPYLNGIIDLGENPLAEGQDLIRQLDDKLNNWGFMEGQYVTECATGSSKGLSLSRIKQSLLKPQGITSDVGVEGVANRLDEIYQNYSDTSSAGGGFATPEALMAEFQKLDAQGSKVSVRLDQQFGGKGQNYEWTFSELMGQVISECRDLVRSGSYNSSLGSEKSQAVRLDEARQALQKIRSAVSDFPNKVASEMRDRLVNCSTMPYSEGVCRDSGVMTPGSGAFCLDNANRCASDVRECHQGIKAMISQTEGQIKQRASAYNNFIKNSQGTGIVQTQQAQLSQLRTQLEAQSRAIAGIFKDDSTILGINDYKSLVIKDPTLKVDGFTGQKLYSTDFLVPDNEESLSRKLGGMVADLDRQKRSIEGVVDRRIDEYRSQFSGQQNEFASEAQKCFEGAAGASQAVARINAINQKRSQDQQNAAQEFCRMASNAKLKPGCEDQVERLYEVASRAGSSLGGGAYDALSDFDQYCSEADFEGSNESARDCRDEYISIEMARIENGGSDETTAEVIAAAREYCKTGQNADSSYNDVENIAEQMHYNCNASVRDNRRDYQIDGLFQDIGRTISGGFMQ